MMAPGDGLRGLKMGKSRHHPIHARLCLAQQCPHQRKKRTVQRVELITDPHPKIDRHLIIARACRV